MTKQYIFACVLRLVLIISVLILTTVYVYSAEFDYTKKWCTANNGDYGGKNGVRMSDGTFADCIIKDYAVEFDWCTKWHECIGQAANYGSMTGLKSMCVLICNPKTQQRYIDRFNRVNDKFNKCDKIKLVIIKK